MTLKQNFLLQQSQQATRLAISVGLVSATVITGQLVTGQAVIASSLTLSEVRSLDGTNNNLLNPNYGQLGTAFDRQGNANYGDGISTLIRGANPRDVSNQVFDQPTSVLDENGMSDFGWAWGQFLSHDISHTLTSPTEFTTIPISANDPVFTAGQAIPTTRSVFDPNTGTTTPREQVSNVTPWLDAGFVYGGRASESNSGSDRADWLRTGTGGKLETSTVNGSTYLPTASQKANAPGMDEGARGMSDSKRFIAGDFRANENAVLTSMHTLLVREHNRIADELATTYASELSGMTANEQDAFIYQSAKKIVGAQVQAITYNEYLPSLGVSLSSYNGYDNSIDPTVKNEFATAGFRLGHSQISGTVKRLSPDGTTHAAGNLNLFRAFFNTDAFLETEVDAIFRGLASNVQQKTDAKVNNDLRNLLFGPPTAGPFLNGTDLVSLNLQRSRDHGLGSYNDTRVAYGLQAVNSFADITDDVDVQQALASVYGTVGSIDLWVGMLAEQHAVGMSIGELTDAILAEQFERLRDGDRFYYANDADFAQGGMLARVGFDQGYLNSFSLGQLISNNTDIEAGSLGRDGNVFFVASASAEAVPEPGAVVGMLLMVGAMVTYRKQANRTTGKVAD